MRETLEPSGLNGVKSTFVDVSRDFCRPRLGESTIGRRTLCSLSSSLPFHCISTWTSAPRLKPIDIQHSPRLGAWSRPTNPVEAAPRRTATMQCFQQLLLLVLLLPIPVSRPRRVTHGDILIFRSPPRPCSCCYSVSRRSGPLGLVFIALRSYVLHDTLAVTR